MNEKIRKLADKAGINYATGFGYSNDKVSDLQLEEFAELIVKECIGITDELVDRNVDGSWTSNELYTDYNGALFEVKRRIKQHFGVEE